MNRRKLIKIAGSSAVIVAAAGVAGFVATRTPKAALAPWRQAGAPYPDPMRRALSWAILAPNPHNRQPWIIDLRGPAEALLYCDLERLLPETDPFDRQIVIGLGCFLELFVQAAAADGQRALIVLFPEGMPGERLDGRPIARLSLVEDAGAAADPLFAHALERRTNREPYDMARAIGRAELDALAAAAGPGVIAGGETQGQRLEDLRELTRSALRDEILDPAAFQESVDLMRIGRTEIEANPDGISLGGPFLETLSLVGLLDREQLADPASQAFQVGLDMADEQALTAMGFLWINTRGNGREEQIAAGRAYLRVALEATRLGLSMQPMSQALQEYAAMRPHFSTVHSLLAGAEHRVQMLARLGYARPVAPAPRWALSTRIAAG